MFFKMVHKVVKSGETTIAAGNYAIVFKFIHAARVSLNGAGIVKALKTQFTVKFAVVEMLVSMVSHLTFIPEDFVAKLTLRFCFLSVHI